MYSLTTSTKKVAALSKKIRAVQGGTSASKTISILLHLIHEAQSDTTPTITSIVSESLPHLKRGAMRDFLSILQTHHYYEDDRWNRSDYTYTFETGSKIEFFSADQPDKLRGARRDRLFINEANNVTLDAFDQLEVRTKEYVYLDWNPTNEFWFYTDILPARSDVEHIILTYKDNEACPPEIVASIEQRKDRTNWWKVYGLGQLGEVDGKIFTGWQMIDQVPHEARRIGRGLDFGYSNDPTAIVEVYAYNGGFILDELLYRKGMTNAQIAEVLKHDDILTIADSAEPKSIDEIKSYGVTILPAEKGKDSVLFGIQLMQEQRISYTKRSHNIGSEYRNYLFERDKEGRIINVPERGFNHAMDAARYLFAHHLRRPNNDVKEFYDRLRSRGMADNHNRVRGAAR